MRKELLFCLFTLTLSSCNNSEYSEPDQTKDISNNSIIQNELSDQNEILKISSVDEWYNHMGGVPSNAYKNPEFAVISRASITTDVFIGYNSCAPRDGRENEKVIFDPTSAEMLGVAPHTVYIVDFCEAKITIDIPLGASPIIMESPECGYKPGVSGQKGYASVVNGNKLIMTTNLTHIKYDILGREYNTWHPKKPELLKWTYGMIIM